MTEQHGTRGGILNPGLGRGLSTRINGACSEPPIVVGILPMDPLMAWAEARKDMPDLAP
jgi:hypothetical protein